MISLAFNMLLQIKINSRLKWLRVRENFLLLSLKVWMQKDVSKFGDAVRKNYGNIFTTSETTAIDMYKNVKLEIQKNPELSATCQLG